MEAQPDRSVPHSRSGPYNAAFDEFPEAYDELRAAGHMARRRAEFFTEVVDRSEGSVLEIGCGTGALLRTLAARRPGREFIGVEPLSNYVEFARERARAAGTGNVRFEVGTGETLDSAVKAGSVGLVISVDTLHHVDDTASVVRAVSRAAGADARWWAMEPNRIHPYVWAYHTLTEGERTFSPRKFLRDAGAGGWQLEQRQTIYLYPSGVAAVPAWAEVLERRLERRRALAGAVVLALRRS
jgi:ubiquinone/menaquinone biosynthesis C-methylase UbiE